MDVCLFWSLYLVLWHMLPQVISQLPSGVVFVPFTDEKTEGQSCSVKPPSQEVRTTTWTPGLTPSLLYHAGIKISEGAVGNTTSSRLSLLLSLLETSKGRKCWQLIWGWGWGRCLWCNSSNALLSSPGWHGSISDPEPLPQLRDPPGHKDLEKGGWKGKGPPDEGKRQSPSPCPATLRALTFLPHITLSLSPALPLDCALYELPFQPQASVLWLLLLITEMQRRRQAVISAPPLPARVTSRGFKGLPLFPSPFHFSFFLSCLGARY